MVLGVQRSGLASCGCERNGPTGVAQKKQLSSEGCEVFECWVSATPDWSRSNLFGHSLM